MKKIICLLGILMLSGCMFYLPDMKSLNSCIKICKVKKLSKIVVAVYKKIGKNKEFIGSGFAISKTGKIATSAHILESKKTRQNLFVKTQDLKFYPAKIIRIEKNDDFAVLKIERAFKYIAKISKDSPEFGGCSVIVGYNFTEHNLPSKTYANFHGYLPLKITGIKIKALILTANTAIGTSGGAVFNQKGEVIGMLNYTINITKPNKTKNTFSAATPIPKLK